MTETIEAIYDGVVFRPAKKVKLKPNTRAQIIVEIEEEPHKPSPTWQVICSESSTLKPQPTFQPTKNIWKASANERNYSARYGNQIIPSIIP